jgi:hypothetical protein
VLTGGALLIFKKKRKKRKASSKSQSRGGHWRTRASSAAPLPTPGGGPTSRDIARQGKAGLPHNLDFSVGLFSSLDSGRRNTNYGKR